MCRTQGAKVLSNSYGGGGYSQLEYESIVKLRDAGALFVASAGEYRRRQRGRRCSRPRAARHRVPPPTSQCH